MADKYRVDKDGLVVSEAWKNFQANGYYTTFYQADENSGYFGQTVARCEDYPGAAFLPPAVYKDPEGRVHLRGLMQEFDDQYSGVTIGTYIFLLPTGYCPNKQLILNVRTNSGSSRLDITTGGYGFIQEAPAGYWQGFICLDGVCFDTRA